MKVYLFLFIAIVLSVNLSAQDISDCKFPITHSPDSLRKYVEQDYTRITKRRDYPPKHNLDQSDSISYKNYMEAFYICQMYLFNKLGESVYCNYVDYSFNPLDKFGFQCGFQLPNIKSTRKCCGWTDFPFELVNLMFRFEQQRDKTIKITYPANVPDCNGLPDCGFKITLNKAIQIAKDSNLINDSLEYRIKADGVNWILTTSKNKFWQSDEIPISIQTGQIGQKKTWRRID